MLFLNDASDGLNGTGASDELSLIGGLIVVKLPPSSSNISVDVGET